MTLPRLRTALLFTFTNRVLCTSLDYYATGLIYLIALTFYAPHWNIGSIKSFQGLTKSLKKS